MSGYPPHGGYGGDPYGYGESGGCINTGGYGREGRYGQSGCIVDNGGYGGHGGHGRYGHSGGCIDTGEYGSRYGHSGGGCIDTGEYETGRYGMGMGRMTHYAEPSGSGYSVGMANAAVSVPPVVSPSFCVPYMAQFLIEQKVMTLSSGRFVIADGQGRLLFDVESKMFGIHTKRILRDSKGIPLVLLKKMNVTLHDRWEAYRGDDSHDSNLLFIMKKSSIYQMKPSFDIYLSANTALTRPDFTLKGDFYQHSYTVFFHHTPIAEASKKINVQSVFAGKDQYGVTVFPGVDHAFIASLIVIVDQIQQDDTGSSK
ncbi:hypothetical protein MPTK1_5g19330 [Marchantia polymorpha subsp. ruderalis]|nr:hypothetical protein MARPO_0073s0011 [Marchantia polymorpha]BBN12346.1 hypothetical protein Mp_5g19330 [Marchantia polymorpha subsp. ruderalis]|eukprot:PTQ35131.1 hypothetical protein MARPO_0073s0011 [Marchantia polymorpha]